MQRHPNSGLSLENTIGSLTDQVRELVPLVVVDAADPSYGGLWSPTYGMADPKLTGHFVVAAGYLLLADEHLNETSHTRPIDDLIALALSAADFLATTQRKHGLIDLLSVNYDSGPDTAFTVQELCTLFELSRQSPKLHASSDWQALLEKLEHFVRRAIPGIRDGGFHTPNHRWVIVSALLQAKALFPDLVVEPAVEEYLTEGFDIDDEGFFIERSIGVYDAVNDRSLLMIGEFGDRADAFDAVARNLSLDLHLIHADATAETGISRRQDYGTRQVPLGLAHCFLLSDHHERNAQFVGAAQTFWAQGEKEAQALNWLVYALLKCGAPSRDGVALPSDFTRFLPTNGLWRLCSDKLSVSVFRDASRLLNCVFGQAELSSIKISQTYFGHRTGHFIAETLTEENDVVTLHSEGRSNPRRPGYELPLNRPVPPEAWASTMADRELRRLPYPISELSLTACSELDGVGLDLRYQTLDGLDRVAVQIAFDFPPGGVWETGDTRTQPVAGQVIFLKHGYGTMRYGNDCIEIGPGVIAHGMWQMRDSESAPEHVRVLFTMLTPVNLDFTIRCYRGLYAVNSFFDS